MYLSDPWCLLSVLINNAVVQSRLPEVEPGGARRRGWRACADTHIHIFTMRVKSITVAKQLTVRGFQLLKIGLPSRPIRVSLMVTFGCRRMRRMMSYLMRIFVRTGYRLELLRFFKAHGLQFFGQGYSNVNVLLKITFFSVRSKQARLDLAIFK